MEIAQLHYAIARKISAENENNRRMQRRDSRSDILALDLFVRRVCRRRLAMDFKQPFRGSPRYMIHCHNLEHEDMGMMITCAVDDDAPLLREG